MDGLYGHNQGMRTSMFLIMLLLVSSPVIATSPLSTTTTLSTSTGLVFEDADGDGRMGPGEHGVAGVAVSNGREVVRTQADGRYRLPLAAGQTLFVVKPAGWRVANGDNGLPRFWFNFQPEAGPALKYGGMRVSGPLRWAIDFPLRREAARKPGLDVLVLADPQTKSMVDVDYYQHDIVTPLLGTPPKSTPPKSMPLKTTPLKTTPLTSGARAQLGLSLGDIVADDLSLYPAMNRVTATLGVPWLHVSGNHDLDFDATDDADSLDSFRNIYGPDTFAWETPEAVFVGFDDVVYRPGRRPAYVGGLREGQFAFLEAYLPTVPKDRLLVLAVHIPLFDAEPGQETFRHADRARLFALLRDFPHVLVLSGHSHSQRHWYHGTDEGWQGKQPLHEYNVGAACGSYWSGVKDAEGIPDSTMNDGTPNGYATLKVGAGGDYALAWHPARDPADTQIGLHAPRVLRQGAYPAWGVYANYYMGQDDSRVEFRVDGSDWQPMVHVLQPDPALQVENMRDDLAEHLRGYDRSPEAVATPHLWRAALPTTLASGSHRIEVRAFDRKGNEQRAATLYRLEVAQP